MAEYRVKLVRAPDISPEEAQRRINKVFDLLLSLAESDASSLVSQAGLDASDAGVSRHQQHFNTGLVSAQEGCADGKA